MPSLAENTTQIIRERRAIFPATFTDAPVADEVVERMLENANHAPTHRRTEPWRFRVITAGKRAELGDLMASIYKEITPEEKFSARKYKKRSETPRKCSHVIAICMLRDPAESLPEWEEVAATAMAVQNLWLTASAEGYGGYWSTPKLIHHPAMERFLELQEGERCLGFFYMGNHEMPKVPAQRGPIEDKTIWMRN